MPISEYSQPFKQSPYIAPIDLSLLAKVNQFKETRFEQNAAKIQETINTIGNLDVMRDVDKAHLNEKVNGVVEGINKMGGVDLSDMSISNQLQGYGSSIYNDDKIITAVTSTKNVRSLQADYAKYSSDPKYKGYYSPINEAYDMRYVSEWLANKDLGKAYSGPSKAFAYQNIDKFSADIAAEVTPNYTKDVTSNGLYIDTRTGEHVDAQKIKDEISARLMSDGNMSEQVKRNSWYFGQGRTADDIYNHFYQSATEQKNQSLKQYEDAIELANQAVLPADIDKYNKLINGTGEDNKGLAGKVLATTDNVKALETKGIKHFSDNIDAYNQQLYMDKLTTGIANTYAYDKETHTVEEDKVAMGLITAQISAAGQGYDIVKDPTSFTGVTLIPKAEYWATKTKGDKTATSSNSASAQAAFNAGTDIIVKGGLNKDDVIPKKEEDILKMVGNAEIEKQSAMVSLIKNILIMNPQFKGVQGENAQVALINHLKGRNNPTSFEIEDLEGIDKFRKAKLNGVEVEVINDVQAKAIKNLVESFDAISKGQPAKLQLTDSQVSTIKSILEKNSQSAFYQTLVDKFRGKDISVLTEDEKKRYSSYQVDPPVKYQYQVGTSGPRPESAATGTMEVVLQNGRYYPADGKEKTFIGKRYDANGINLIPIQVKIGKEGVPVNDLNYAIRHYNLNGLSNIGVLDSRAKDNIDLSKKIKQSEPDPKAFEVLNAINTSLAKAFSPLLEEQSKGNSSLNRLQTTLYQEALMGSAGVTVKGPLLESGDESRLKDAYIEKIQPNSNNPFDIEVTMVIPKSTEHSATHIKKVLTPAELKEYFNISLPPTRDIYDQALLDVNRRTSDFYISPTNVKQGDPVSLIFKGAIVKTGEGPGNYTPQLYLPDGKTPITLRDMEFPSLTEAKTKLQETIDIINTLGYKDTPSAIEFIKQHYSK